VAETETISRPPASGHRFGPDLSCTECGITWEAHQKEPAQCNLGARDVDTGDSADETKAKASLNALEKS
jgi:hypothetical protein